MVHSMISDRPPSSRAREFRSLEAQPSSSLPRPIAMAANQSERSYGSTLMDNGGDSCAPPHSDRIKLNVGGKLFETTASTLESAGPDSLLFALSNRAVSDPNPKPIFIDRDPDIFSVLLSLLRTNRLPSTSLRFSKQDLADEALYYGLDSRLRSAMSPPPLDGIDACVVATISPAADGFPSSFAAGVDGSVCMAHSGQISSYDWNLSHATTIRTHFEDITSIRRVWPDIAAVGSESAAGLHFYDFSAGRHVGSVHWSDPSDPRIYKARVTAIADSSSSVYASFESSHRENSVIEIDKSTLQTVLEFGRQPGSSTKNMAPGKLIWLPETKILAAGGVTSGAFGYSGYIRLWDPRSRDVVWETNEPGSGRSSRYGDSFVDMDADVESSKLFKVCSKSGELGMADLRKLGDDPWVYLKDKNPSMRNTASNNGGSSVLHCYRRQVFVGREGDLEVWSRTEGGRGEIVNEEDGELYRRNYVNKVEERERERERENGVIRRMEGGGDRLFVSREDVEGLEVWESSNFAVVISVS